eukprot:1114781-Pyramimonas_sp.AAC.1
MQWVEACKGNPRPLPAAQLELIYTCTREAIIRKKKCAARATGKEEKCATTASIPLARQGLVTPQHKHVHVRCTELARRLELHGPTVCRRNVQCSNARAARETPATPLATPHCPVQCYRQDDPATMQAN